MKALAALLLAVSFGGLVAVTIHAVIAYPWLGAGIVVWLVLIVTFLSGFKTATRKPWWEKTMDDFESLWVEEDDDAPAS